MLKIHSTNLLMQALHASLLCGVLNLISAAVVVAEEVAKDMDKALETKQSSALERRIRIERETRFQPFVLTPHKPNYILPITYKDKPNNAPFDIAKEGELDKTEVKFQISMKFPVAENLFGEEGTLYFAYTNLSFWQAYNSAISAPFRETVHEPEVFLGFPNDWEIFGFRNRLIFLGIVHQSNGRSGSSSRSWNRVYADFVFQRCDFYLSFRPWYRIPENIVDDNPDIEKFMGHGEVRAVYASGKHTVGMMFRNNFHGDNKGAYEINWSFPMSRRVKWFVQYFNGYGESLIDYNAKVNRFGIGVAFTDWL